VDHALKEGDSLVGESKREITQAIEGAFEQKEIEEPTIRQAMVQDVSDYATFHSDSRTDADDRRKRQALQELDDSTAYNRCVGDLLVAACIQGKTPKDRKELRRIYLEPTLKTVKAAELKQMLPGPLQKLREGDKGIKPLHWEVVFRDVFDRARPGFDVFVGNPPFAGKNTIAEGSPDGVLDWYKQLHPESHGNSDLVAHFFRRCFHLLRPGGTLGLIATNTIAQGDTRSTGLRWICHKDQRGSIYAARKRMKWPGVAAVVVSVVHLQKGLYGGLKLLDGRPVEMITAFLFANGGSEDPKQLAANAGKSYVGSYVLGMGFTFDDSGPADDDTPGIPSPIATMERLIAENPKNAEVIFPYIGGEEVNSSPTHAHHRYVINFEERSEEECRRKWPDFIGIVELKVKPDRLKNNREGDRRYWWQYAEKRGELNRSVSDLSRVLVTCRHQSNFAFAGMLPGSVFAESLVIIADHRLTLYSSDIHEAWSRFLGSSLGDGLRYTPSDCFETFPFPTALIDSTATAPTHAATRQNLEAIGERYHQFRAELMVSNNEGLTSTYNRFHDPAETSSGLLELRRLHGEMDKAVLNAYGWSDVPTACGFGLDYLYSEEYAQLPDELQERIDSGELFFWEADESLDFQGQLQAYGAITGRRKLPWRYHWPDAVRDDVLARLLALNAERYEEEVNLGLHSKGAKQAAKAGRAAGASGAAATGKRRGRPPNSSQPREIVPTQTEQMGLGL
jgi:hypothetical protein